jgi:hypothetical protein
MLSSQAIIEIWEIINFVFVPVAAIVALNMLLLVAVLVVLYFISIFVFIKAII